MTKQTNVRGDPQDVFVTSSTPTFVFGTRMHVPDGRVFRRSQADSTALVAGRAAQTTIPDVGLRNKPIGTSGSAVNVQMGNVAIGSASDKSRSEVPATRRDSTRGPFIDEYAEGLLYVVSGGGAGHVYRILTSEASDSVTNNMRVFLDAVTLISADSDTRVTLLKNFFKDLVISQAPPSAPVIGVSPVAVPLNHHFWLQTQGAAAVLQQGDLQINLPIAASPETAGAVRHAIVVVPDSDVTQEDEARSGFRSLAVVRYLLEGNQRTNRLAPVSGMGVVPETQLGYVIDTGGYDGAQALVHLDIEV